MSQSAEQKLPRQFLAGWCLFDFAASLLMGTGGLYFSTWLVLDNDVPQLWFNLALTGSSVLALVAGPLIGAAADRHHSFLWPLKVATAVMFLGTVSLLGLNRWLAPGVFVQVTSLALLAIVTSCYSIAMVFYNAILKRAARSHQYTFASGWGIGASWLGAVTGVVLPYPFVAGLVSFVPPGREQAFLPAATAFAVLSLISFSLMQKGFRDSMVQGPSTKLTEITALGLPKSVIPLLLSYFLFMDAILTIQNNLPLYLDIVVGADDRAKAGMLLVLFCGAALGGIVSGYTMTRSASANLLAVIFGAWTVLLVGMSLSNGIPIYCVWLLAAGILLGFTTNGIRSSFLRGISSSEAGRAFGVYTAIERASSLTGPLIWALAVRWFSAEVAIGYRAAIAAMAVLMVGAMIVQWRRR